MTDMLVLFLALVLWVLGRVGWQEKWFGLSAIWSTMEVGGLGLILLVVVKAFMIAMGYWG